MNLFFFIGYIFINSFWPYAQFDSINFRVIEEFSILIEKDTMNIKVTNVPNQNWLERNEGAFIAALLASIVAIFSVYLTARSIKKQRLEREKEIYCGLLDAIKIELMYHEKNLTFLIKGLEKIKSVSIKENEIIIPEYPRNLSLNFLRGLRNKLIETELLNANILRFLSYYINKCEIINADIDFECLMKLTEKLKGKVNFQEATKSYFDEEIKQVKNIQLSISGIIKNINANLTSLGRTSKVNEIAIPKS